MKGSKDLFEFLLINEFVDAKEDIFREILIDEMFANRELIAILLEH